VVARSRGSVARRVGVSGVGVVALAMLAGSGAPAAAAPPPPTAAHLTVDATMVRARPSERARVVGRLRDLRPDFRLRIVRVLGRSGDRAGGTWYRVALPGRPNGRTGFVRAEALRLRTRPRAVVIVRRGARRLEVRIDGRRVLRTRVAVGKPGAETPLGRFHVTASFRPTAPVLGRWAIETSAYSRISDWPGGGIVGIHGTRSPELLGQAVSHGCVRVADPVIRRVAHLAPPGTPVVIVR